MPFIEGYARDLSIAAGEEVALHVSTDADRFDVAVHRLGAEDRLMARFEDVRGAEQPVPSEAWENGCGWSESLRFPIPLDWPSGAYRARLSARAAPRGFAHWCEASVQHDVLFVVRAADPGSAARILLQLCTNTYNAYNKWGGHSLYAYHSLGNMRAHKVSFERPGLGFYDDCRVTKWEIPFIQWAERAGYALEYATNVDLETRPEMLERYRLVLSVGHDEYWSGPMRDNLEAAIERGLNVAFFSGNSVCWQVRFEDDHRTMRCHKEASDEDPLYMTGAHRLLTGRFTDTMIARPENHLTGVTWDHGGYHRSHGILMDGSGAYTVKRAEHWVYEGSGLKDGEEFGGASTIVGYETDGCLFEIGPDGRPYPTGTDGTPRDFQILAQSPAGRYEGHQGMATMGLYTRGGTVFTAGTTDWAHGLSQDPIVARITKNVLDRLSSAGCRE